MSIIDRRIAPKVETALINGLIALWRRCPDCSDGSTLELGSGDAVPKQVRYPLTWPAWMYELAAEAANDRAMSVATWLREAALEKLERAGKGRPDLSGFEVAHKDGDPLNNSPDNLELRERKS